MADPTSPPAIWQWLDSIWGFGAGVLAGVLGVMGWVSPKLKEMRMLISTVEASTNAKIAHVDDHAHEENDALAGQLHGRITTIEKLITALQENHGETMRMYQRVEDQLKDLNRVTYQQNKILYQMQGALKIKADSTDESDN